ncbi:MAG: hypothetical protein F6K32_18055 [Desertifilum sp. SIO1I2]|nr:hypothetical protein [Desertifilum sp. SIO1I2]
MLTHHRKLVSLSLVSTDLPVWSAIETAATIYQKDRDRFHLLLSEPVLSDPSSEAPSPLTSRSRLLWLEISPYRVILTMQGNGKLSYRHLWEYGMYGLSRYWLYSSDRPDRGGQLRLRNFTRSLELNGRTLPKNLRLEYELWSDRLQLGSYILNLDIHS